MDPRVAEELIADVDDVRLRARGDRRATSVPLITFGTLTVVDAAARTVTDPRGLWLVLAPAGLVFVAWYYRRQEARTGVGTKSRPYWIVALAMFGVLTVLPFLVVLGITPALAGLGLLAVAIHQRNRYLGAWAVIYGLVAFLEGIHFFSNRLSDMGGYFSWSSSLVLGLLGLAVIAAGLRARQKETARR